MPAQTSRATSSEALVIVRRPSVSIRRLIVRVLVSLALVYALVVVVLMLTYRRLLYPAPVDFPRGVPESAKLVEWPTADGARVRAMLFAGPASAPMVVHFHGNHETMNGNVWIAEELRRRGLSVTLVEYRGYGLSTGEIAPTESGLYADAAAALDNLESLGYGRDRVVLWGQSLGSGVAAEMASRGRARAVVLVTPYTSMVDMGRLLAPRALPVGFILRDRFDTLAKAARIGIPTLVVHGDTDELIPHAMGERVAKALPNATFYTVKGGHHGDLVAVDPVGVFEAVVKLARQ